MTELNLAELIPVITFIFGVILTALIKLPITLLEKKSIWKREKKAETKYEFYENVAKINYLIGEYFKEYCDSEQSLTGYNLNMTESAVFDLFNVVSSGRYKAMLYMDKKDYARFESFVEAVKSEYDGGKESYGLWDSNNAAVEDIAVTQHAEGILSAIEEHTVNCLRHEFLIQKNRRSNR